MNHRELVELKLAMEFGTEPVGDTLPPAISNKDAAPRVLVSAFGNERHVYFRFDLPHAVRDELSLLEPDALMQDEDHVKAVLEQHAPCRKVYRIRWYTIESSLGPDAYPDVTIVDGKHVVIVDGKVVAWAKTDCEHPRAAEVSIETIPAFRRRGYARQVTLSWAASVLSGGKIAYYSHLLDNAPSQAVAEGLGLHHLSDEVEYL